ncbi:YncE family protein [Spirosoma sp. HMF4905]|uniref:YncE family protein n=1 Tax=Spirosoma arboris TaxID=2682092 RepID=A0A7K1SKK9_9BACT|nr:YncE family protein [Spirosoma arboris]MVM34136.1 YncE family protein [Spirosoma arboris]
MKHLFVTSSFLLLSYAVRGQQSSLSTELPITNVATVVLKLDGYPDFLVPDNNNVWITNVKRIDKLSPTTNKPILSVPVPEPCGAMAVGFGAVWVANCSDKSIYRIDRLTGKLVAKIPTGLADKHGELSLAVGDGSVWVLSDSTGILARIDPKTNKLQATIRVLPFSYCVAFGYGAVWITNTGQGKNRPGAGTNAGSVQRIDPQTNKVVVTIPTGMVPRFLAVGENGVWTLNQGDGSVSRIDPYTNKLIATIDVKATGLGGDIAAGAGKVWVRGNKTVFLATINPKTNSVDKRYGPISGSGAVRVTNDKSVWISSHDINTVWIIKP